MIIESKAFARAGLLGNPSDGYFGKTISISVRNFAAKVSLQESSELRIEPQKQDLNVYRNIYDLVDSINLTGYYGGTRLVKATIKKFCEYCSENHIELSNKNFSIRYQSSIPRQVGLAGSSAIITATVRALMKFYDVEISREILPNIILSVETEELNINAGLQDRVVQVYEGCVFMDFDKEHLEKKGFGKYEKLDPQILPNLYIAYKTELGKISGKVLNDIRTKFEKGDSDTIEILAKIASCAEQGKAALLTRDHKKLAELINLNFDLRRKIMDISESNIELVETARRCGASAKFAGSGGSIIGTYSDEDMLNRLVRELKKVKAQVITPEII